ncbi:MAG: hypothetical protein M9909_07000 [Thermomicrobiales bacterium]|nr:hypothetical protein [Thermomicrobiales bacterium]
MLGRTCIAEVIDDGTNRGVLTQSELRQASLRNNNTNRPCICGIDWPAPLPQL